MQKQYDPDDLEKALIEMLHQRSKEVYALPDPQRTTTDWTREIQNVFLEHSALGEFICKIESKPFEFLWDVCYITSEDEEVGIWNFVLAAEIEWGQYDHQVLFDFRKLLAAKVPYRFMIFDRTPKDKYSERLDAMINVVPNYFNGKIIFVGIKNNADKSGSPIFIVDCREFGNG